MPESRFCAKCGAALAADSRFCDKCGQAVAKSPAPQALPERQTPESLRPSPPAPAPARSGNSNWLIVGCLAALVVLCLASTALAGAYLLTQNTPFTLGVSLSASPIVPTLAPVPLSTQALSAISTPTVPPALATLPAPSIAVTQTAVTLAPTPPPASPYDLYVKRIGYLPADAAAGQVVRFNVLYATDTYPQSGPFFPTTRVRWRPSANADWTEALCQASDRNASCSTTFEFTYTQPGTYEFATEVDSRSEIAETNELNNSSRITVTVRAASAPTSAPKAGPTPSAVTFSSAFDEKNQLPVNPGKTFPYGVTIIYAYWTYKGAVPNTPFEYEWYRDGTRVDGSGENFTGASGKAFQWLNYGYQPKDPLDAGSYRFVVRVNGQILLQDTFVIQPPQTAGPVSGAITVFFTIQNGNPTGWVYDKQGAKHTPQYGTIGDIRVSAGDRIVVQTDQSRFSLLFDCSTSPGTFNPCDFSADSTANLPKEIRAVKSGMSGYLNISRADNWAGVRPGFAPQRYPADPVLRIGFTW